MAASEPPEPPRRNTEKIAENQFASTDDKDDISTMLQRTSLDIEMEANELESPQSSQVKIKTDTSQSEIVGGQSEEADTPDENNVERLKKDLKAAREQIQQLKNERKKLRSEKGELIGHVKQLGQSLQDKEQELRDFIRNYEVRVRENDSSVSTSERDRDRERWSRMKQETEHSMALAAQLTATQEQLAEARRQLSGFLSEQEQSTGSCSRVSSYLNSSNSNGYRFNDRLSDLSGGDTKSENCEGICINMDSDSISIVSSGQNQHMPHYVNQRQRSPTTFSSPMNVAAYSQSMDNGHHHVPSRPTEPEGAAEGSFLKKMNSTLGRSSSRTGTWGSISKVFRTKSRRNAAQSDTESVQDFQWNEDGYAEKLKLLRDASNMSMEKWRTGHVIAWMDMVLGLRCAQTVSGKVLLELSDVELAGLGISHPMHRKKLRLAIEEHRRPEFVRYPLISQLGHTWVSSEWLPDIGLPQYIESFLHCLVDARMLDTLSKKELEKMLGVTRKFHQASIVHGIHVLRLVKYDRQELAMRRHQAETIDTDPVVWTNLRFVKWVRTIDLGEYADNLKDSGVHGGFVLEPSFTGDTMATALGIPQSKNIIRRHLAAEFDNLVLPARGFLGQGIRSGSQVIPITGPGGLQHGTIDRKTTSRTSLSKVFSFNKSSTSPTPSYSSSENGYAPIGSFFIPPPPPTTAPPSALPSHRVSAPVPSSSIGAGAAGMSSSSSQQHRRVKSISDIASPVSPVQ